MENLIFSFNVVMPVFLVVGLGYFVKYIGMVDDHFVDTASKFNFRIGLPALLFKNIYSTKLDKAFNPKLLFFTFACIAGTVVILCLIVPIFIKDKKRASAMIQTVYRSNFSFLGIPLAINMLGEANIAPVLLLLPVAIPSYAIFAVLILAAFDENNHENKRGRLKSTMVRIIKNPLIIGSMAGVIAQLLPFTLPQFLTSAISSVASLGTPLALITLGAQLDIKSVVGNLKYSIIATVGRLVVVPGIAVILAVMAGFRNYELGAIFVLFSSPSAITSYVMAKEMNSDYKLTGDIIILTTLFSMFTIFMGIYLLRTFSLL